MVNVLLISLGSPCMQPRQIRASQIVDWNTVIWISTFPLRDDEARQPCKGVKFTSKPASPNIFLAKSFILSKNLKSTNFCSYVPFVERGGSIRCSHRHFYNMRKMRMQTRVRIYGHKRSPLNSEEAQRSSPEKKAYPQGRIPIMATEAWWLSSTRISPRLIKFDTHKPKIEQARHSYAQDWTSSTLITQRLLKFDTHKQVNDCSSSTLISKRLIKFDTHKPKIAQARHS